MLSVPDPLVRDQVIVTRGWLASDYKFVQLLGERSEAGVFLGSTIDIQPGIQDDITGWLVNGVLVPSAITPSTSQSPKMSFLP